MQIPLEDHEIEAIADEIADRLSERSPPSHDGGKTFGIDPGALYSVSFLADRWDVSEDTVRRMEDRGDIDRVDWAGSRIRFRGAEVLRVEGVDIEANPDDPASETQPPPVGGDGEADTDYPPLPEL